MTAPVSIQRRTLSAGELARVLGVSPSHVRALARRDGHVAGIRAIAVAGRWVFSRAEVDALLRNRLDVAS